MPRVRLYYNPLCSACVRQASWTRRLDWLGRVDIVTTPPEEGPVPAGQVAVRDLRTGELSRGGEALRRLCANVPAYWPFALWLALPFVARRYG